MMRKGYWNKTEVNRLTTLLLVTFTVVFYPPWNSNAGGRRAEAPTVDSAAYYRINALNYLKLQKQKLQDNGAIKNHP